MELPFQKQVQGLDTRWISVLWLWLLDNEAQHMGFFPLIEQISPKR